MLKRIMRIGLLLLVILIALAALLVITADDEQGNASAAILDGNDRILVWTAPVIAPGQQSAAEPGVLSWMDQSGGLVTVLPVPQQANRVAACGRNAVSPDGRHFALFMGNDGGARGGSLYIMTDGGAPVEVDTVQFLACIGGNGRFTYSPNSQRFGYLAYTDTARTSPFAQGALKVGRTSDYQIEATIDSDIVAFDISNDGVVFVKFFTNQFGQADEFALSWWDGSSTRELMSLTSADGCEYTHSHIRIGPGGYWMILSERCGGPTKWQLFRVEPDGSNAVLAISTEPRGGLVTFAETNNLMFVNDNHHLLYTLPDGVSSNTVQWFRAAVDDLSTSQMLIERDAVMPTFEATQNAPFPIFSKDGKRMAVMLRTPQDVYNIAIFTLDDPEGTPTILPVGEREERVPFFAFTGNENQMVYVSSELNGGDGSLFLLDTNTGESTRVRRGMFSRWAYMSPSGNEVASLDWIHPPEDRPLAPTYLNLVVTNLESGETTLLMEGEIRNEDGSAQSHQFALPIYWLR